MNRYLSHLIAVVVIFIMVAGCSSQKSNPVSSEKQESDFSLPVMDTASGELNHQLLGMWDINFDLENMTAEVVPNREMNTHYNVTLLLPGPQIDIISFDGLTGMVDVDITIDNPSTIDAYDVRFIVMTDSVGHMLQNSDNWTDLYDQPGGLPINPFIAYANEEPNRLFAGPSEHTETLTIYLPGLNPNVTFAIDASVPGNCLEPYSIDDFLQYNPLTTDVGSYAYIDVSVFDWQDNAGPVYLYCPAITGTNLHAMLPDGGPNGWAADLLNNTGASAGEYTGFILAYASDSASQALYEAVIITVEEAPPPPPVYNWTKTWGGTDYDYIEGITTDSTGNIITTGYFYETVDFNPDTGIYNLISNGEEDAFLSKLDSNGNLQWAKSWGGDNTDEGDSVVVDDSDYIYASGCFRSTTDFDPGPGEEIHTPIAGYDCYLSKFDPNGNFQWVKIWGGEGSPSTRGITIDSSNDLFIAGNFTGTVDFDPGIGIIERFTTNIYYPDAFVSKFDSNGILLWVNTWGGNASEIAFATALYNSTELFIVGTYKGECDFDPGPGEDIYTPSIYQGLFISKWDSDDGNYHWTNTIEGRLVQAREIVIDNQGGIYLAGEWQEPADFDPGSGEDFRTPFGSSDAFLTKQNVQGGYEWTKTWGAADIWQYDAGLGITIDSTGSIVVTGSFGLTCDFDPGPDTYNLTSSGEWDCFLSSFNPNGNFLWAYAFGGVDGWDQGRKLISDGNSIYVSGTFEYTADFDPGPGTDIKTGHSYYDVFISKYVNE